MANPADDKNAFTLKTQLLPHSLNVNSEDYNFVVINHPARRIAS